mmetsp:Transcript_97034/g.307807  ORF Transcript_97034/g.307807 Transcript_97034/m.307807 type:complete len:279 (+) Transcript_97034:58-894(+)
MPSAMKAVLCVCAAFAPAWASRALGARRQGSGALGSLVRPIEFKHKLRVCNAFPYATPLELMRGKENLTSSGPLAYKECRDFAPQLLEGDRLEFKVGDDTAGTFAVGELPANDAVLLLVVQRHDQLSTAVSFESHTFAAGVESPQIAVIDTYKGSARSTARIADVVRADEHHAAGRDEELRFDNAVAVSPGAYEVMLAGSDGEMKANSSFVALNRESYVVLRTGVEAKTPGQQSYPQELIVYPQSPVGALHSGVRAAVPPLLPLAAVAALLGCAFADF